MTWDSIVAAIKEFFNQDITVIISSIITIATSVLVIISKTSIGKKALNWCKAKVNDIEKTAQIAREKVTNVENLAQNKIDELKAEYEAKSRVLVSYFECLEQAFVQTVELIPNAKVQNQLTEFKSQFDEQKAQILQIIGPTYEETQKIIDEKVAEAHSQIADKEKALDDALERANNLLAILETQTEENEEITNGEERKEREETENSNPEEETI